MGVAAVPIDYAVCDSKERHTVHAHTMMYLLTFATIVTT